MAISPVNPPSTLSSQRLATLMNTSADPSDGNNWVNGWGYPPNRYGALLSIGARLKHRTNIYNGCNITPYQDMLATTYIKWLTISFKFPRSSGSNVGIEMVPNVTWGRIRPDLNGGKKEWVQLNVPTGGVSIGIIDPSGQTTGGLSPGDVLQGGRIVRLPHNAIIHPWAIISGNITGNHIDAPIKNLVSQNPADDYADSRLDCIVCDWWIRLVPFNEALPMSNDFVNNPVICVASADPYVSKDGQRRYGLTNDGQCVSAVAASPVVQLTTTWQQVGYFTSTDAPDKHTTLPYAGISTSEFLSSVPPGYDNVAVPPPQTNPDPIIPAPSTGNWRTLLTGGLNTWDSRTSAIPTAPTSLANDTEDEEMLLQQSAATAAKRTIIFRAVDATDGFTAETGLSWGAGDIKISKNGAAEANHAGTVTELGGGLYKYEFALAEVDTAGVLSFRTNKAGVRPTSFTHQVVGFDPANATSLGLANVDAAISSRLAQSSYEGADAILDKANGVETGMTLRQALRLMAAVLGGRLSGSRTGVEVFRNAVADSKNRVTATIDSSGNRTVITTDLT